MSVLTHPSFMEFAARQNADTVARQAKEITALEAKNDELRRSVAILIEKRNSDVALMLETATAEMAAKIAFYRNQADESNRNRHELQALLESAVIPHPTKKGESVTMWDAIENEWFRSRCSNCDDLNCEGCGE